MVCWNLGIKAVGTGQAVIFLNIMPLMGVGIGIAVLDEVFYWQECFGAVEILSGVHLITQARQILHLRNVRPFFQANSIADADAVQSAVIVPFSTLNRAAPGSAARSTSAICGWQVK